MIIQLENLTILIYKKNMKKVKYIYTKIIWIVISFFIFGWKVNAWDLSPLVLWKTESADNYILLEKNNFQIFLDFILNNICYFITAIIIFTISIIYYFKKISKKY